MHLAKLLRGNGDRGRRSMRIGRTAASSWLAVIATSAGAALAVTPRYTIVTLGFTDPEHTRDNGTCNSAVFELNHSGQTAGVSTRYAGAATNGASAWFFDGAAHTRIGLFGDALHTAANGAQYSSTSALNDAGQVAGYSRQYNGGANEVGQSAWVYAGGMGTVRIGLLDAEHTATSGHSYNDIASMNQAGQVVGFATRYSGDAEAGQSNWLYTGGNTIRIGLFDAVHTSSSGEQYSDMWPVLNASGQVAGTSNRYEGGGYSGASAWLYSGGTTSRIGLFDPAHTSGTGEQYSTVYTLNDSGVATGISQRYGAGNSDLGRSLWIHGGGTTARIGLIDAEHTSADGFQYTDEWDANAAGQVAGISQRYNGGSEDMGLSSWFYSNGTTMRIGLTDGLHTASDGYQESQVYAMDDLGHTAGYSDRYLGTGYFGSSSWAAYNGVTTQIGLVDGAHTRSSGYQYSEVDFMNGVGHVAGWSSYFVNDDWVGDSAWIYDGSATVQVGFTDAQHVASDGARTSYVFDINDAGQAIGISDRYSGTSYLGQSGWFHDLNTDQTEPLVFSQRDDGYAYTWPDWIGPDGVVIGTFTKFSGSTELGDALFYWSLEDGFHELGDLIAGGLAAAGWDQIADLRIIDYQTGPRYIAGQGTRSDGSLMAYLLQIGGGGAWLNPAGGSWQSGSNWSFAAPPTAGDDAVFNLAGAYTVALSADADAHDLRVSAGDVTLDLAGHRLTIAGAARIGGGESSAAARLGIVNGTLNAASVSIGTDSRLDLTDNDMIVDYSGPSPLAAITALIASGRNGGLWNGSGIVSSTAATDQTKSLGIADNASLGLTSFSGQQIDATSILVKFTWLGDATLDGKVDVGDLGALASNWQQSGGWMQGDFDYSGVINVGDLGALATNWQKGSSSPLGPSLTEALAALGLPNASIPEPAAIALAALFYPLLTRRNPRRQSRR